MTPVNFVFFTVGERYKYHGQLIFCLLSIKAHLPPTRQVKFTILTDHPEYYSWLGEQAEVITLSPETIEGWKGEHGFFWRVKIAAILEASYKQDGHTVYFDTDTACFRSLEPMLEALDSGSNLMHLKEFDFSKTQGGTGKKMKSHGLNKQYGDFTLSTKSEMWNAGVVAISQMNDVKKTLQQALIACDAMCADGMERKLIEQFSLSLALRQSTMLEAQVWVKHYWGNKEQWNQLIADLLAQARLLNWSIDKATEAFSKLNLDLPEVVKETKLQKYQNSLKKRLPFLKPPTD